MNRRDFLAQTTALAATSAFAAPKPTTSFPAGFLWGAATAGHQIEGNNLGSDLWLLENVKPTIFAEPSGDADNSFELWPTDLDLVKSLGLNAYRFSLEWARIEPEPGQWSIAMLDHYKRIIDGCRARGIEPVVTFNHVTTPRWFAAQGGWLNPASPTLYTRFCERAAKHLAGNISHATTLNEPNLMRILYVILPPQALAGSSACLAAAAHASGSNTFATAITFDEKELDSATTHLLAAHKAGRAAIKSARPDLPVGVSLAMLDDQAVGPDSVRDAMRTRLYGQWLDAIHHDDFLGVQNYERVLWGPQGKLPAPPNARKNAAGAEVYPGSLAGAVRYAHQATGLPIVVTEHGVNTEDDTLRAWLIPRALADLKAVIDDGIPVGGYLHWSLLDNFEWVSGFKPHFGLCAVDRTTFRRTPKPSASVLGAIARHNALA